MSSQSAWVEAEGTALPLPSAYYFDRHCALCPTGAKQVMTGFRHRKGVFPTTVLGGVRFCACLCLVFVVSVCLLSYHAHVLWVLRFLRAEPILLVAACAAFCYSQNCGSEGTVTNFAKNNLGDDQLPDPEASRSDWKTWLRSLTCCVWLALTH